MVWSLGLFAVPLLFCLAPLASPSWTVWALVAVLGALLLGWGWAEIWQALAVPADDHGMGAALAVGYAVLCSVAFLSGLSGRALGLALQGRGRRRRQVLWTDALGLAGPLALLLFFWLF